MSHCNTLLPAFIEEIQTEFPSFRIVNKSDSRLAKLIDLALRVITLGGQREFMTRYYTVVGDTLYVPPCFHDQDPVDVVITLRHERIHLRQKRRLTMFGMTLLYLFLPFPLGLSYGRALLEWEAYAETLKATFELRGAAALRETALRTRIVSQFTSPAYGWMWPFRKQVEGWYDRAVAQILAESGS